MTAYNSKHKCFLITVFIVAIISGCSTKVDPLKGTGIKKIFNDRYDTVLRAAVVVLRFKDDKTRKPAISFKSYTDNSIDIKTGEASIFIDKLSHNKSLVEFVNTTTLQRNTTIVNKAGVFFNAIKNDLNLRKQPVAGSRRFNIALDVDEFLLFKVAIGMNVDFRIGKSTSAGFIYRHQDVKRHFSGYSFGVKLNYLLNSRDIFDSNGWFVSPYVLFRKYRTEYMEFVNFDGHYHVTKDYRELGVLLGHQLFSIINGFNVQCALGIAYTSDKIFFYKETGYNVHPVIQLTFGYAF